MALVQNNKCSLGDLKKVIPRGFENLSTLYDSMIKLCVRNELRGCTLSLYLMKLARLKLISLEMNHRVLSFGTFNAVWVEFLIIINRIVTLISGCDDPTESIRGKSDCLFILFRI